MLLQKTTNLIGIIGLSAAIAITGNLQISPQATATNISQNPLPATGQLTQLDKWYANPI